MLHSDAKNIKLFYQDIITADSHQQFIIHKILTPELANQILRFHGSPYVWLIGIFVKFLFQPQTEFKKTLEMISKSIKFKSPTVGYDQLSIILASPHIFYLFQKLLSLRSSSSHATCIFAYHNCDQVQQVVCDPLEYGA